LEAFPKRASYIQADAGPPVRRERRGRGKTPEAEPGAENGSRQRGVWVLIGLSQEIPPRRWDQARVAADPPGGFSIQSNFGQFGVALVHGCMLTCFAAANKHLKNAGTST